MALPASSPQSARFHSVASMNKENLLARKLQERIRESGAIPFRDWMAAALYDPHQGYYCTAGLTRWGRKGDYRTSPERSSVFAATFARYFVALRRNLPPASEFTLVEVGAGAGDFAFGVLENLQKRSPDLYSVTRYVIDEQSEDSRRVLREKLKPFETRVAYESLESTEAINPGIVFANELLDAFPVHRVTRRDGELREFYVTVNTSGEFAWQLGELSNARLAEHLKRPELELAESQIAEVNLEIENWLALAASKLLRGYLILVDYGAEARQLYNPRSRPEGTLRSLVRHQFSDNFLENPGSRDLTTTIDWTLVRSASQELGFRVDQFEMQDQFLMNAGILDEMKLLTDEMESEAERVKLRTHAREMILPTGMAESFQVLVLSKGV
jgi:SAM-dependent MidA family methyltransferase